MTAVIKQSGQKRNNSSVKLRSNGNIFCNIKKKRVFKYFCFIFQYTPVITPYTLHPLFLSQIKNCSVWPSNQDATAASTPPSLENRRPRRDFFKTPNKRWSEGAGSGLRAGPCSCWNTQFWTAACDWRDMWTGALWWRSSASWEDSPDISRNVRLALSHNGAWVTFRHATTCPGLF